MTKVIGFDSWTGGVQNYERLAQACVAQGIDFGVVHIGSWGGDPGRPAVETIAGVRYRDIGSYGSNRLDAVLDAERPDAVVFLSTDTFAHRAFNRLCRARAIPTLHLYHGLVSVQDVGPTRAYEVQPLAQLRFVLERIPKALRYIWPAYMRSMMATGAPASDWRRFIADILVMASGRRRHTAAPDTRTDKCCVYVDADRPHAVHRFGFRPEDVVAVGNPDLTRFGLDEAIVGSRLHERATSDEVVYIDTGLVYTGYVFLSPAEFIAHLVTTRDALARQGRRLVFKPHPDHARSGLLDELRSRDVALCSNEDLVPTLRRACAAIVEPSSLAIVPALMGLPVFLAQYGPLANQRYGAVLTSYPRQRALQDLARFHELLGAEESTPDAASARRWIDSNAGPLPAARMPTRVVDLIEQQIEEAAGRAMAAGQAAFVGAAGLPGRV